MQELELYRPDLLEKPSLLLVNKMDKPNAKELFRQLENDLPNLEGSYIYVKFCINLIIILLLCPTGWGR